MRLSVFVLVCGFAALPLTAPAVAGELDLNLPDSTRFGAPYAPPGTLDSRDDPFRAADEDDGKVHVHGSFTTGFGYSKGLGSTRYNAAHVNLSKSYGDEHPGRMSLDLEVRKIDGPGAGFGYGGYDDGYGPYPGLR